MSNFQHPSCFNIRDGVTIVLEDEVMFLYSVISESFVTPSTVTCQASLSMGFPRQRYWSGFPFPSPGDLPDPGIKLVFVVSPVLAGRFFTLHHLGSIYNHSLPMEDGKTLLKCRGNVIFSAAHCFVYLSLPVS